MLKANVPHKGVTRLNFPPACIDRNKLKSASEAAMFSGDTKGSALCRVSVSERCAGVISASIENDIRQRQEAVAPTPFKWPLAPNIDVPPDRNGQRLTFIHGVRRQLVCLFASPGMRLRPLSPGYLAC